MRKTKIICTLGPATDSPEMLAALIAAGANVFRLNMSHATHEWVRTMVPRIREVARQTSANVAIGEKVTSSGSRPSKKTRQR
jgi:pyruvate kinase